MIAPIAVDQLVAEQLASGADLDAAVDTVAHSIRRDAPHVDPASPDWDRLWHEHFAIFDAAIRSTIRAYALHSSTCIERRELLPTCSETFSR